MADTLAPQRPQAPAPQLFTVEIVDAHNSRTLIHTAGTHYAMAVTNAVEEVFDGNHPDLADFEHEEEDGFASERERCLDNCKSIRVFAGHVRELDGLSPVHSE